MAAGTIERVRKNKDGTTSYRLSVMIDGKRYRKTVRCETKTEANRLLADWVVHCEDEVRAETTFGQLARSWVDVYASKRHKRSTLDNEIRKLDKWIMPDFGDKSASKISRTDVQAWVEKIVHAGLDPKTVRNLYGILKQVCDWATSMEYIKASPCQYITLPSRPAKETHSLTADELDKVMNAVHKDAPLHYYAAVCLAAYCGMRKGEILGLTWKDINQATGTISINKTRLYQEGGGGYIDTPKSKAGTRTVHMPDAVASVLVDLATEAATRPSSSEYVISHANGDPVQPQALAGWVRRFRDAHPDLPLWSMHTLRHTHASMLKALGTPLEEVQKRLGHADKITTQKIYTHLFTDPTEVDASVAHKIDDFLSKK